jgi:hypothetical protein
MFLRCPIHKYRVLWEFVLDCLLSPEQLRAGIIALRHQLNIARGKAPTPIHHLPIRRQHIFEIAEPRSKQISAADA